MAGVLHTLLIDQHVYVLEIPGSTEAVGVNRLTPLVVSLLMTVPAVLGGREALGADELSIAYPCIRGKKRGVFPEGVVIVRGN
jgi:hypothetical protein